MVTYSTQNPLFSLTIAKILTKIFFLKTSYYIDKPNTTNTVRVAPQAPEKLLLIFNKTRTTEKNWFGCTVFPARMIN